MTKAKKSNPQKAARKKAFKAAKKAPSSTPNKNAKKKASKSSRAKSASKAIPMDADLMDATKSNLSATFRNIIENENLGGHEFLIIARERRGITAARRPCPRGFHLEIDPETGVGICVRDRPR